MYRRHRLTAVFMGIDTHQESVVYMREDCHVCRAEGFNASSRIAVEYAGKQLIASLNIVTPAALPEQHMGFSRIALQKLKIEPGAQVTVGHAPIIASLGAVRKKIYGHALSDVEMNSIIADIATHRYRDIEVASFLSVCAGQRLSLDEIIALTRAMVGCGERLTWPAHGRIFDKHCIGGLPGNRTTPLVVAIVSAAGLVIPKTSSRAITSPAGTADTMETLTNVSLSLDALRDVVTRTGACLAWGGAVNLSPADDLLIRIERALDLDGEGQLIASVLSKKIAAGSTHVLIDIPVGDTAKVRTLNDAERLADLFAQVSNALGIQLRCVISDGSRPIGRGIGPVEEARDVLAVLQCQPEAPQDLRTRAIALAAELLDLANGEGLAAAEKQAADIVDSGRAWAQFQRILNAQGGIKSLPHARQQDLQLATASGVVRAIDNRRLARLAKLAGAPADVAAGLRLHANVGDAIIVGAPLFTLLTDSPGEREYALDYYQENLNMFDIGALV